MKVIRPNQVTTYILFVKLQYFVAVTTNVEVACSFCIEVIGSLIVMAIKLLKNVTTMIESKWKRPVLGYLTVWSTFKAKSVGGEDKGECRIH